MERLDRLEAASVPKDARIERRDTPRLPAADPDPARGDRSWLGWIATGVLLGLAAAAVTIGILWTRGEQWLPIDSGSTESLTRLREEPLPIPAATDVSIARARAQYERGHLRERCSRSTVGPGDPLSAEADQLKATIQAKLLEPRGHRFPRATPRIAPADEMSEVPVHQFRQRRPLSMAADAVLVDAERRSTCRFRLVKRQSGRSATCLGVDARRTDHAGAALADTLKASPRNITSSFDLPLFKERRTDDARSLPRWRFAASAGRAGRVR